MKGTKKDILTAKFAKYAGTTRKGILLQKQTVSGNEVFNHGWGRMARIFLTAKNGEQVLQSIALFDAPQRRNGETGISNRPTLRGLAD